MTPAASQFSKGRMFTSGIWLSTRYHDYMRLLAMISSTIAGMEADRRDAANVLESIGFETLMSERAGSVSESPATWCETAARECDLFVLLLGPDYGWVIPEHGLSVVEYEFNTAIAVDRSKVLVFLREMPANGLDPRQTTFIDKVCNFSTGHFRATAYSGGDELVTRLRDDTTRWLQDRLREAQFAPESIALLTARRPFRATAVDLGLMVVGAITTVVAISLADPFYRKYISWLPQLSAERIRWLLTEDGAMLAKAVSSLCLGVSLALVVVLLLGRRWPKHVSRQARFLSGGLTGVLLPVSLVGPLWFGFDQWQVILLGTILVCAMTLSRFAEVIATLGTHTATELVVSVLATRAWVPAFLAVAIFINAYCAFYIGGGLFEVWLMAHRQFLEGIKLAAVILLLASLWLTVSLGNFASRQIGRFLLLKRIAYRGSISTGRFLI